MNGQNDSNRRKGIYVIKIAIALCCASMLFCGYKIYKTISINQHAVKNYDSLCSEYITTVNNKENIDDIGSEISQFKSVGSYDSNIINSYDPPIVIDFEAMSEVSDNIVGWLYWEDTMINYPIMQTDNNDYYLSHLPDGTPNSNGSIFLDSHCSNNFTSRNSLIYGHHMKNGSMFGKLKDYYLSFNGSSNTLFLNTPEQNYEIDIIAGFSTQSNSFVYTTDFPDESAFSQWLHDVRSNSLISSDENISINDRLITLSTCDYSFENARFVIIGKLVNIGQ